jgi:hypothetical protein
MADIDPHGGSEHSWTVKLRLAIDADDESEARAIVGEVIQAMGVVVAGELQVTRTVSRRAFWDVVTDLDLSPAGNVSPDDALTRFRYVIRNLPDVTFMSPRGQDSRTGLYQWRTNGPPPRTTRNLRTRRCVPQGSIYRQVLHVRQWHCDPRLGDLAICGPRSRHQRRRATFVPCRGENYGQWQSLTGAANDL